MIDDVASVSEIKSVAKDGTVTLETTLTGVTLKVYGATDLTFSTVRERLNRSARSSDYSKVFKYLTHTPFTAKVSPDGQVTSISGKIVDKIKKVKELIPDEKVNGKDITFFTEKILTKEYIKGVLSVGWLKKEAANLETGEVLEKAIPTPPVPGNAHGTFANMRLMEKKVRDDVITGEKSFFFKCRSGFGKKTGLGQAGVLFSKDTNMVKKTIVKIENETRFRTTVFNVNFKRTKQ